MNISNQLVKPDLLPLTSLRFISAFWVFLFHINLRWPLKLPAPLCNIISQGPLGMSVFFILSGFVLTYSYFDRNLVAQYRHYLSKRFARIYPVYIFASLITLPWFNIHSVPTDSSSPFAYFSAYCLLSVLNLFLLQAWFPSLFNYWINGSTWSLSVEWFFYLLFPYILTLFKAMPSKSLKVSLFLMYLLSTIPSLLFVLPIEPKPSTSIVYALPMYRLPECIVGIILAIIFIDRQHSTPRYLDHKLICYFLLLMIYLSLFANIFPPIYVIHNFFAIPIIAIIIYYCANLTTGFICNFLSSGILVFLGKTSYSFYLMQSFPILFVESHYQMLVKTFSFISNSFLLGSLILLFNLVTSFIVYYVIENPLRGIIVRYTNKKILLG
jgi:peptidoglycan/LPS O-acetylase OafA/YrhL